MIPIRRSLKHNIFPANFKCSSISVQCLVQFPTPSKCMIMEWGSGASRLPHLCGKKMPSIVKNVNAVVYELSLSAVPLICVLCIYNTVCPCFVTGNHSIGMEDRKLSSFHSLKLPDRTLASFCKTVIGALLDNMQGPHSALGHVNLDRNKIDTEKCAER